MKYLENPPRYIKDKTYVDALVNDYIELLCIAEEAHRIILDTEMATPSINTAKNLDMCYNSLTESETGIKQIVTLLKTDKIRY